MDANTPISEYYPKDDSIYIDKMYAPYQTQKFPIDNEGCYINLNTWKQMGNPNYVNPAHYRREWNWDFKKLSPNDPCPAWSKDLGNGYCVKVREEGHSSNFYTSDIFAVKYQYFDGYTLDKKKDMLPSPALSSQYDSPTFKAASINPWTGKWVIYHDVLPNKNALKYGNLPSRSSYLGH
jgi:hypothetical protein